VQPINFVLDHAKWTGSIVPAVLVTDGVATAASMTGPPLVLIVTIGDRAGSPPNLEWPRVRKSQRF
jgi:hypothetical protein